MKYIPLIVRLILGSVFILSAVLKAKSINDFELVVFGINHISFDAASILSRGLCIFEFFLGSCFIAQIWRKGRFFLSLIFLLGFSLFLLSNLHIENCHCFGSDIPFSPIQGVIKNGLLIVLLCFDFLVGHSCASYRLSRYLVIGLSNIIFSISLLIYSSPDILNNVLYSDKVTASLIDYQIKDSAYTYLIDSVLAYKTYQLDTNKRIYGFFSAGCKFCQLANQRLIAFNKKIHIADDVQLIFIGDTTNIASFIHQTSQSNFDYKKIYVDHHFAITKGKLPIFILHDKTGKGSYYLLRLSHFNDRILKQFYKPLMKSM